jgi:hypothetical protein
MYLAAVLLFNLGCVTPLYGRIFYAAIEGTPGKGSFYIVQNENALPNNHFFQKQLNERELQNKKQHLHQPCECALQ